MNLIWTILGCGVLFSSALSIIIKSSNSRRNTVAVVKDVVNVRVTKEMLDKANSVKSNPNRPFRDSAEDFLDFSISATDVSAVEKAVIDS